MSLGIGCVTTTGRCVVQGRRFDSSVGGSLANRLLVLPHYELRWARVDREATGGPKEHGINIRSVLTTRGAGDGDIRRAC